jgi:hypothetical protein
MEAAMCRGRSSTSWWSIVAFIVPFFLSPSLSPAQARKASLKEMTETSSAVITGRCLAKESAWNKDRTKIFTRVRIQTGERIKGDPGTEVVVTVPGGQVGSTVYEVSDIPSFAEGEEMLVFLWNHPSGKTLVTGALQGKLSIVEEKVTGRKIVQGASLLLDSPGGRDGQTLQKTAPQGATAGTIPLEDVKAAIRAYVRQ